jgi:GNAT superfamily N-acetyltransferase
MQEVVIRPIRRSDRAALEGFYAELSDDARAARFLGCSRGPGAACVAQLSAVDGIHEAGLVAIPTGPDSARIVGHISLTDAGPGKLEIAVAVSDAWQHTGIGTGLLERAVTWAAQHHATALVATAFADNWRVLALLHSTSRPTEVRFIGAGLVSVVIRLDSLELKEAA